MDTRKTLAAGLLIALPLLALWTLFFHGFVYDDAYITARFSANLAEYRQLTWSPGEPPVEGFTSFAAVVLGAAYRSFGGAPETLFIGIGVLSWLLLVGLIAPLSARLLSGESPLRRLCWIPVLAIAANASLALHAFQGLETLLFVLSVSALSFAALKGNYRLLGVLSVLALTVRPDAAIVIAALWALSLGYERENRRGVLLPLLAALAACAIYVGLKWRYFGYPFPNTFYVKGGGGGINQYGYAYVKDFLKVLSPLWLFLAFAAYRAGIRTLLRDRPFMLLFAPSVLFCALYVKVDPILGQEYRFLIPILPSFILAAWRALVLAGEKGGVKLPQALCCAALVILTFTCDFRLAKTYPALKTYYSSVAGRILDTAHLLERVNTLKPIPMLATGDVGAMPYFSRLPTLDVIGLTDSEVAHHGLTSAYFARRKPDILILQDLHLLAPGSPTAPPVLMIDGQPRSLDRAAYSGRFASPHYEGRYSTFRVVSVPGFSRDYTCVESWDFGGHDRYYLFIRNAYPRFREVAAIFGKATR